MPPLVTLHTSTDAPLGEALTHQGASVLIGEGLRAIIAERMEQVQKHNYTIAGDQMYEPFDLPLAATSYANAAIDQLLYGSKSGGPPWRGRRDVSQPDLNTWPWDPSTWKPGDPRANLVKAAALIWAAIDRIDHGPRVVADAPFVRTSEPETIIPGRACRDCGCTDERACMDGEQPCHWIAPDLCSACEPVSKAAAA